MKEIASNDDDDIYSCFLLLPVPILEQHLYFLFLPLFSFCFLIPLILKVIGKGTQDYFIRYKSGLF